MTLDTNAIAERLAEKTALITKCSTSTKKQLEKDSFKIHGRSLEHKLDLVIDELSVTIKGTTLTIALGEHQESFELTTSKSGSLFPHWIKLNKALVSLAISSGREIIVTPPESIPPSHARILALIGFEGSVKDLTSDIVEALQEASTDEELSKSNKVQAVKTAEWITSFLSNLTSE